VSPRPTTRAKASEIEALRRAVMQQFDQYVKLNKKIPPEILTSISSIDDPGRLADTIAAHLPLKLENKQAVLDLADVKERLENLFEQLEREVDILNVDKKHPWPRQAPDGEEPARLLPERAGQGHPEGTGRGRRGRRHRRDREEDQGCQDAQAEARKKAEAELKKLKLMSPMSAEATVVRNYIDVLVSAALEQEDQDQARPGQCRGSAERRPLRPGQGQGPHP
jgi:ATP-dependent Lon protease